MGMQDREWYRECFKPRSAPNNVEPARRQARPVFFVHLLAGFWTGLVAGVLVGLALGLLIQGFA